MVEVYIHNHLVYIYIYEENVTVVYDRIRPSINLLTDIVYNLDSSD